MCQDAEGFVGIVPNAYTDEECDRIIAYKDKYPKRAAEDYNTDASIRGERKTDDSRLSDLWFFRYYDEPWILDKTMKLASKFNDEWCHFDIDWFGLNHEMQLAEYNKEGDWFDWHRDYNFHSVTEHKESIFENKYKRKITAIIQLTDIKEYEGARLLLNTDGEGHIRQDGPHLEKGSIIFFPSFVNHKVTELLSGIRNSFTIWYLGPPWR